MQNLWSGSNAMKKKVLIMMLVFSLLLSFTIVYIYTGIQNRNKCEATYIKDADGDKIGISYNGRNYYDLYSMMEDGFFGAEVSTDLDDFPLPYSLVSAEEETYSEYIYIEQDDFSDYALCFDGYFYYYSETFDKNRDFIIDNNSYHPTEIYVDENFSFPTIENNSVDEVWMSQSSDDKDNIKDKQIVNKVVECAKSDGEIELDKDMYDYIKKYSWDNHCFYLKCEGYPIVEEFHLEETEDGRYIVDQYTPEEYNTIYREEEAHQ